MGTVNPPPLKLPNVPDKALFNYLRQLQDAFYLLWYQTGAGTVPQLGVDIQPYDAETAKYDDTTANFTGTLQNGGSNVVVDTDIGSTVQAYDAQLADIAGLTPTDSYFIVGDGSNFITETGATVRTSLGLGSSNSPSFAAVVLPATTPASATATGTSGTVIRDADYIYVCTATDTWKRAAITTWP